MYCPVPVEGYELVDTRTHSVVKSIKGWNEVQKGQYHTPICILHLPAVIPMCDSATENFIDMC